MDRKPQPARDPERPGDETVGAPVSASSASAGSTGGGDLLRQRGRVDHRVAKVEPAGLERPAQERHLDHGHVRDQHPPGEPGEQLVEDLVERRGPGEIGLPKPVDPHGVGVRHPPRPDEPVDGVAEPDLPARDGDRREGDDLVGRGVEPGQLQVYDAEARLARHGEGLQETSLGTSAPRGIGRPHGYLLEVLVPGSERCTAATSRKASRR